MATKQELVQKYTEAFQNFSESENDWKAQNSSQISDGYSPGCKDFIDFYFSESGRSSRDASDALSLPMLAPMRGLSQLVSDSDPVSAITMAAFFGAYNEQHPTDDFSDIGTNFLESGDGYLDAAINSVFQSRCGKDASAIEQELDAKWQDHKAEQIFDSAAFQEDYAAAREAGQNAVECAEDLVKNKEQLNTIIENFYSQAGPKLFNSPAVINRGGFAGSTDNGGFLYLQSLKDSGASPPGYINLDTVSFGENVSTVYPVITADDSITSKLKFAEKPPTPLPPNTTLSQYPVLYFSMLLNAVKGTEYILNSDLFPTNAEVAAFNSGAQDSSIPLLRKVGGASSLQKKFSSDNFAIEGIEIDENAILANNVDIQSGGGGSANFTQEQKDAIAEANEAGSLVSLLESYTPNMLGQSNYTQVGNTPQSTQGLAEAYSRKVAVTDFMSNYVNGVLSTINRSDMPSDAKDFIKLIAQQLDAVLRNTLSNAQCVRDSAAEYEKEKKKIMDALTAAAKAAGEGNAFGRGTNADPNLARDLVQAAKNIGDEQIEDTAFQSLAEKKLFKEQCFLLAFVAKFADYKKNTLDSDTAGGLVGKRLPYTALEAGLQTDYAKNSSFNASLQVDGLPYGFINRLTQTPNYKSLIDVKHSILSHLQPRIRLFKVVYDEVGTETEVEIEFNSAFFKNELERTFKSKKARGAGVGLQNFEFTYDGSNPFAAKKSIKAHMSLYAASFSELFDTRIGNSTKIDENGNISVVGGHRYRYVDLALKTSNNPDQVIDDKNWARILEENGQLSKLNFRLKAVVGWSMPTGKIAGLTTAEKVNLNNALSDSFVTLNLTPTVHNFEFNETGAVRFDINYLAYVDDFFDQRAFNVFANPNADTSWQREMRRLQFMNARKKCSTADSISQINDTYKEKIQEEMKIHFSSLIKALMDNDKVYFVNFPYSKVQDFVSAGPYRDYKDYVKLANSDFIKSNSDNNEALAQLIEDAVTTPQTTNENPGQNSEERNTIAHQLVATAPEDNMVSFFYVSDLVDIALENIQKELTGLADQYANPQNLSTYTNATDPVNADDFKRRRTDLIKFEKNFKRFRLLLGPVELHHIKKTDGKTSEFVNFGDIPISVKYFMEWITGQVLSKDEMFYPLSVFLNQLLNNLVSNFLNNNRCFYFDIKQKIRVNQSVVSSYSPPNAENTDKLTELIKGKASQNHPTRLHLEDPIAKINRPILNVSGRSGEQGVTYAPLSHETNYLVFYAGRVASPSPVVNRQADEEAGIFHYMLGKDRGLIKNISLQKTQTKGLAEARFEMDGYDGLQQLRVVYDVDIDTFANVNTFPGTYIYIPPGGFDPSWSKYGFNDINMTSLGIGGYYMIIKSTHRFGPGEANTQIFAKWVNSLESDYPEVDSSKDDPSDPAATAGCEGAADRLSRALKP